MEALNRAFTLALNGNLAELRPLMIDRQVAVDVVRPDGLFQGYTLLHAAASKAHVEVVEFLLSAGASPDVLNAQGKTALALARDKNHLAIVEILERASSPSAIPPNAVPPPTMAEANLTTWSVEYNGRFEPFDAVASERLESAYQMAERPATVSVTFQHETHKVHLSTMEMCARGAQYQVLRLEDAEPSGRKRSMPSDAGASSSARPATSKDMDSIDWDRLVIMYDADANGLLDPSELVCFVRDAISLVIGERIDYDLATEVTFLQIAGRRECWSGRDVRVDAIKGDQLRLAAARGVFSELRLARAAAGPLGDFRSSDADLAKRLQEEEYAESMAADGGASVGSSLLGASSDKLPRVSAREVEAKAAARAAAARAAAARAVEPVAAGVAAARAAVATAAARAAVERVVSVMVPHLQLLCFSFDLKRWKGAGEGAEGTQKDVGVRAVGRLKGVLVASMLARTLKRSAPVDKANADFDAAPAGMDASADVPPTPARQSSSRSSLDSLLAGISQGLIVRRSVSAALRESQAADAEPAAAGAGSCVAVAASASAHLTTMSDGTSHQAKRFKMDAASAEVSARLPLGELMRRARLAGAAPEEIEDAVDSDEPKVALLALIEATLPAGSEAPRLADGSLGGGGGGVNEAPDDGMLGCGICTEQRPRKHFYGGRTGLPTACGCEMGICLSCVRESSRSRVREGRKPACLVCLQPLPAELVASLLKMECPLCGRQPGPTDAGCGELRSMGCGHDHRFCGECAGKHVLASLQARRLPRCPRHAECVCVLEQPAIETALRGLGGASALDEATIQSKLLDWHDLRTSHIQDEHPLLKPCRAPDCRGRVALPRAAKFDGTPIAGECSDCRQAYCSQCMAAPHPGRSCAVAAALVEAWVAFLRSASGSVAVKGGGGGKGGGSSVDSAVMGSAESVTADGLAELLLNMEQRKADREHLKRTCKRCPKCARLIEKLSGCDAMVCGRDYHSTDADQQGGCGHAFDWSSLPILDEGEAPAVLPEGLQLDTTQPHFGLDSLSPTHPPTQLRCVQCVQPIVGTAFRCVRCDSHPLLCWSCVRTNLTTKTAAAARSTVGVGIGGGETRQPKHG